MNARPWVSHFLTLCLSFLFCTVHVWSWMTSEVLYPSPFQRFQGLDFSDQTQASLPRPARPSPSSLSLRPLVPAQTPRCILSCAHLALLTWAGGRVWEPKPCFRLCIVTQSPGRLPTPDALPASWAPCVAPSWEGRVKLGFR